MPQKVDPLALAEAHSITLRQLACLDDLPTALEWGLGTAGPALLRVCTDRRSDAQLRRDLREAVQQRTSHS
jgi:2-succinyl-5-enolpyruvyl-6-hydroxy-3-cyclohexene-1-carboxylate synthase